MIDLNDAIVIIIISHRRHANFFRHAVTSPSGPGLHSIINTLCYTTFGSEESNAYTTLTTGFEPTIQAGDLPQTHAATEIGSYEIRYIKFPVVEPDRTGTK
jgi:hypothetical protein